MISNSIPTRRVLCLFVDSWKGHPKFSHPLPMNRKQVNDKGNTTLRYMDAFGSLLYDTLDAAVDCVCRRNRRATAVKNWSSFCPTTIRFVAVLTWKGSHWAFVRYYCTKILFPVKLPFTIPLVCYIGRISRPESWRVKYSFSLKRRWTYFGSTIQEGR